MKGYKIKHLDKLENKIPKKLVSIIVNCLNPNPHFRCDLNYIYDQLDAGDRWRSGDFINKENNLELARSDAKNRSWFDDMKIYI